MVVVYKKKYNIIILAAGLGNRLRPLTIDLPKPLVNINGKPIIHRLIEGLPEENVNRIDVVTGYKSKLLKDYIIKMNFPFKIKFHQNLLYKNSHCSSSLIPVTKFLEESALLFNSDIVFRENVLKNILKINQNFSFVVCKKTNKKKISDLQKIFSKNKIIKKWDLNLNDFTSEVIGPIYLNKKDGKIVSNFINHNKKNILNLPGFSLLSKFLINNQTNEICILENDCFEIDTVEDLNYASRKLSFND